MKVRSEALTISLRKVSERDVALPAQVPTAFSDCIFRSAGIKQPDVGGMTPQAVRYKVVEQKRRNAIRLQPAFPAAVQDDGPTELSPLW